MVSFALMITQATILLCKSGEPRLTDEKTKKAGTNTCGHSYPQDARTGQTRIRFRLMY